MKAVFFLAVVLLASCRTNTNSTELTSINITGRSRLSLNPDIAQINITVSSASSSKDTIFARVNQTVGSLINEIKDQKFKHQKLYTSNYESFFRRHEKTKEISYHASQNIELTIGFSVKDLEKVIQIIRKYPEVRISVYYDLSSVVRDSVALQLASMALKDAADKSGFLARNSKLRVVNISSITYNTDAIGSSGGGSVDYEMFDENGNSFVKPFNELPEPIEVSEDLAVTYLAVKD